MRHPVALLVALGLFLGLAFVSAAPGPAYAQSGLPATIQVLVTDQSGLSINGAIVEVVSASSLTLVSAGRTVNGSFTTQTLPSGEDYTVTVSTPAQTATQSVSLGSTNVVLQFTLMRSFPVEDLIVSKVTQSLNRTSVGWDVVADVSVNNTGASPITFSQLDLTTTGPLTVLGAGSIFSLGAIPPGGGTVVRVVFGVQTETAADIYPIAYVLTFTDVYGMTASSPGSFGVDLTGTATGPDVVISAVSVSTNTLSPGNDAGLTVDLLNAGDQNALGVAVDLGGLSGMLSANSSYAGVLTPSGTASRTFGIRVPPNAQVGVYSINITLTYASQAGKQYKLNFPYSLRIYARGEPLVTVQNVLTDPSKLTDGTTGVMTVFLTNLGTDQARNVVVKMSGSSGLLANGDFRLGEIDPGATQTVLLTINVDSSTPTGTYLVTIQMSYSDPVGNQFNQSSFQELSVYTLPTIFTTVNIGLMALAGVIIIAVLILARRLGIRI